MPEDEMEITVKEKDEKGKKLSIVNPLINKQRTWLRKADFRLPELKKVEDRNFNDLRIKRFGKFMPQEENNWKGVGANIKPPVKADEKIAKDLASPGQYPVFENGAFSHYEDSVPDVVDEIKDIVDDVHKHGDLTEAQWEELQAEMKHFTDMARTAYKSAIYADRATFDAAVMIGDADAIAQLDAWKKAQEEERSASGVLDGLFGDGLLSGMQGDDEPDTPDTYEELQEMLDQLEELSDEYDPYTYQGPLPEPDSYYYGDYETPESPEYEPPPPPPEPKPKEPPPTPEQEVHLKVERAVFRAKDAQKRAEEARKHAFDYAQATLEMRKSLQRMYGLVKDASLTSHGIPEDKDDKANALVMDAQKRYKDVYDLFRGRGNRYTQAGVRLDRAFFITEEANKVHRESLKQRENVLRYIEEQDGMQATKEQMARARREERKANPDRFKWDEIKQVRVDSASARFFGEQRANRNLELGKPLDAKFPNRIPPPPLKEWKPAKDVPGRLRDYQQEIMRDLRASPEGESVMVVAPTGAGKTKIFSSYIKDLRKQKKKVAILVHRQELIEQAKQDVKQVAGEDPGMVFQSRKEWNKPVTVISHGTVSDNPEKIIPDDYRPDVLIIDEAHHSAAEGYQEIIKALKPKKLVGVTATPYRHDGKDLSETYDTAICRVDTRQLVEDGWLVPPNVVDVPLTDKDGKKTPINKASNLPELYAQAIAAARRNGRKKVLVFVSTGPGEGNLATDIVKYTTDNLRNMGENAKDVLGSTDEDERREAIKRFQVLSEGVLINFGTLNEGFDAPGVDAIILGRNVGSDGTLAQIAGRGMRIDPKNPNKRDVLIMNFTHDRDSKNIEKTVYEQVRGRKKGVFKCKSPDSPTYKPKGNFEVKEGKSLNGNGRVAEAEMDDGLMANATRRRGRGRRSDDKRDDKQRVVNIKM